MEYRQEQFPAGLTGGIKEPTREFINGKCYLDNAYDTYFEMIAENITFDKAGNLTFVKSEKKEEIIDTIHKNLNKAREAVIHTLILKVLCVTNEKTQISHYKNLSEFFMSDEWARKIVKFIFENLPFFYNEINERPDDLNYTYVHFLFNALRGNLFETNMEKTSKNIQLLKDFLFVCVQKWNLIIVPEIVLKGCNDIPRNLKNNKKNDYCITKNLFIEKIDNITIDLSLFLKNPKYITPTNDFDKDFNFIDRVICVLENSNYKHYDIEKNMGRTFVNFIVSKCGGKDKYKEIFNDLICSPDKLSEFGLNLIKTNVDKEDIVDKFADYAPVKNLRRNSSKKQIKRRNSKSNVNTEAPKLNRRNSKVF